MAKTQVSRDPFARQSTMRELAPCGDGCNWCGGFRWRNGVQLPTLFVYSTDTDGGSNNPHRGKFCSKGCHDAWHS